METLRLLLIRPDSTGEIGAAWESGVINLLPTTGFGEAIEALSIQKFDAILLDPALPLGDLSEFAGMLRGLEKAQSAQTRTPVILISDEISAGDGWTSAPPGMAGLDALVTHRPTNDVLLAVVAEFARVDGETSTGLPIFEEATFLSSVGNDAGLVIEVIDLFFADCARQFPELHRLLAGRHEDDLARIAHSFKGSLSSLQAPRARARVQELESAAKNRSWPKCEQILAALGNELEVLEPVLSELRVRLGHEATPLLHCGCFPLPN